MRVLLSVFLLQPLLAFSLAAFAWPDSFTYRGGIGDENGVAIAGTNVPVIVRLYAGATDEKSLWCGVTNVLTEANGSFQIEVSDALPAVSDEPRTKSLVALLQGGEVTHVGITLGDDAETYPRQPFVTFPAVRAAPVAENCANLTVVRQTQVGSATVAGNVVTSNMTAEVVKGDVVELNQPHLSQIDARKAKRVTVFSRADDCPYIRKDAIKIDPGDPFPKLYKIFPPEDYPKVLRGGMLTASSVTGDEMMHSVTFLVPAGETSFRPNCKAALTTAVWYKFQFMPFAEVDE